jgi:ABC-type glycerol-3-phosphate transport system substrate-binding protein
LGLLVSSNLGVEKYDEQGNLVSKVFDTTQEGSAYYQAALTLYEGSNGTLFTSFWGENGMEFRTFDPASGKLGEKSAQFSSYDDYSFFTGKGYDLYVSKADGFYGYTQSKDSLTKIMDYADSDINLSYAVSTVVAVSENEFIANLPDEEYNYALYRLTKVAPEDVKDKVVITLAGNYVDYTVRQKVFNFNKESNEYKIKIVDYSSLVNSDDYEESANQFNLDIVSGNVPDIMYFSTEEPVDSYINKGLFLDLNTYLQNDPELKDVEFVENVMDAFKTGDKLYQLAPSFYIESLATKKDYLGGKETLTLKECDEMIQGKGVSYLNSFGMYDKQSLLYSGLVMSGSHFIDWETKTCHFDGEEFINFLEFANKFPDNISDEMWEQYEDTAYMKGDSLFSFAYVNGFRPYRRYVDATFGGDIRYIGFPNNMGVNCSIIVPEMRFAISAQSKNADAAWQLIRQFLLEDYQNEITYEFPIRKSSFDKLAADSMERMYWIDDDGVKQYEDDIMYLGDEEVVVQPLTQEEVDYVKDFVGSLTMVYNANENVYNIITEEASAFFSGQKSAKEVADIIQSRVTIYVNENS